MPDPRFSQVLVHPRACETCGAHNMVDDETDLCDTCWCALSDDKSIEEARLEVEDMAAWGSRHFGRADGKRCTCGTVDHVWIAGPKVRGRGAGSRMGHIDLDVKHEQGCPLAPPAFDWPKIDEDARERVFGYRGQDHHRARLVSALHAVLADRRWLESSDCDRCGEIAVTTYVPEYGANFCPECAADPQAVPEAAT